MFVIFLKIFSEFFVFPILNCEAAQKNNKILKLSDDFSSPCQTRVVGMSRLFFSVRMCRGFEQQMLIRSEPDGEKCEESLRRRWIENLKSFTCKKKKNSFLLSSAITFIPEIQFSFSNVIQFWWEWTSAFFLCLLQFHVASPAFHGEEEEQRVVDSLKIRRSPKREREKSEVMKTACGWFLVVKLLPLSLA